MKTVFPDDKKIDNPSRLILTIYTGPEHFSFSLHDPNEEDSFIYNELTGEGQTDGFSILKEAFLDNTFFSLPFRKVIIMYRTPAFTFIPISLYEEESKGNFFQFQFPDKQGIILNDVISNTGISVIYQLPEEFYHLVLRLFAKPVFIHYSSPIITFFFGENPKYK